MSETELIEKVNPMNVSDTLKTRIITMDTSESPESTGSKRNIGQVTTAQVTSHKCTRNILCIRGLTIAEVSFWLQLNWSLRHFIGLPRFAVAQIYV